jgi:hypothetical protein
VRSQKTPEEGNVAAATEAPTNVRVAKKRIAATITGWRVFRMH